MSEAQFEGRAVLITGGARGIGRATAVKLGQEGANVAINYVSRDADAEETKLLVEREGARAIIVKADVSEPLEVERMVAKTREEFGMIDMLVVSAGISYIEGHDEISYETYRRTMAVNLDGTFLSIMAVKDEMLQKKWGRIVCLSSVAALRARKMQIHYSASKAAIQAMVKCFAEGLAPSVRINAIAPGLIDTEMGQGLGLAKTQEIIEATPLGRLGEPEDIANAVYFLLSDLSGFMTGQTIVVSGGRAMAP